MEHDPSPSVWAELRTSLAGVAQDYTVLPLRRAIFLLAVPMVLETCMESLFAIVDMFWVARLGAISVAAVGLTETLMTIFYGVATGASMATTAMVARRVGEKDAEGAAESAVQAVILGLLVAAAIAVPGVVFAPQLLRLMNAEAAVVAAGGLFTRIMLGSTFSIMLLFVMNAIFRGAGDPAISMRVLWFANAINLVLDPCLIYGLGPFPRMGVTGAAVATTIGRTAGVALQFWLLAGAASRVRIARRHLRVRWAILSKLGRVSANGALQYLISQASWVWLIRIIATFGSEALAGYTVAIRMIIFTLMPSWGLSNAATTLVGQNLGARRPERAAAAVRRIAFYNMAALGVSGAIFLLFTRPLVTIFTRDAAVIENGMLCLRIISSGNLFYALGMVLMQAFNGAGDTATPTRLNLVAYWLFQLPLAWWLAVQLHLGAAGAYWAIPSAEGLLAGMCLWMFRRGAWKQREI
ncbi:MAG: MATE family efflux transporter [Bryobacteraceae bacterium]